MTVPIPWSAIVKELVGAGLAGAALVSACQRIEAAQMGSCEGDSVTTPVTFEPSKMNEGDKVGIFAPESDRQIKDDRPMVNRVAIARKALSLAPGLSGGARRVGAVIMDHFNRATGRCDPAINSMAAKLSVSRRTIIRKLAELEAAGLIARIRHGGYSHRNAYRPHFDALTTIVDRWDQVMAGTLPASDFAVSPSDERCQDGHVQGVSSVTQTHVKNPDSRSVFVAPAQRRRPNPAQKEFFYPVPSSLPPSSAVSAEAAAEDRLWRALRLRFSSLDKDRFAVVVGDLMSDSAAWNAAVAMERHRPGTGLAKLLTEAALPQPGTGPPAVAAG